MAETATREQLSVWLEKAQAQHAEMTVLLRGAEEAQARAVEENNGLRRELGTLRANVARRGCCTVDGGEDANASD